MAKDFCARGHRLYRNLGVIVALLALFGGMIGARRNVSAASSTAIPQSLGYNLDFPGDWTDLPPFIDLMKNARAAEGGCPRADAGCNGTSHLSLDAQGWVKSLVYRDNPALAYTQVIYYINTASTRYDIGQRFAATWEGNGDVEIGNGGSVDTNRTARRITFTLRPGNTFVRLSNIDSAGTGNYVKNVKVFRLDHVGLLASGEVFNPEMLRWLAPFRSVRFMDWMQSNTFGQCSGGTRAGQDCYAVTNPDCGGGVCLMPGQWSERPTADQVSYISWGQFLDNAAPGRGTKVGGYPVETMIALANRASASPHFNMPAAYSDDYVQHFAEYVRDHLASGLVASVEYSNEAWNWGFPQADYVNELGRQLWPNEGSAWVQFAAARTNNLCRIWKQVFHGQEGRMRCLISPQTGWQDLAATVLDCPAWVATHPQDPNCTRYVDAINITGYFSGCLWSRAPATPDAETAILGWLAQGRAAALDHGFQQLLHGGLLADCDSSLDATLQTYDFFARLARARNLGLVAYESGTHFSYDGDNAAVQQFLVDLTRDARMYDAYRRNIQGFWQAGGSTFNVWGWITPNDAWANADSPLDFSHPKYRAELDAVSAANAVPLPWRPKLFGL